jgi:hypothetical protein
METLWRRRVRFGTLAAILISMALGAYARPPAESSEISDAPAAGSAAAATPAETGSELFAKLVERNREREALLKQYTGTRQYELRDAQEKLSARTVVRVQYQAPDSKTFKTVSEKGSRWIRLFVFNRLIASEQEAAAGSDKRDSSITPHNYTFRLLGEEDVDGYHCFHLQAVPKRRDKYLFEGEVWVDAQDFAIVRILGHPARNPSFWIKHVDWVRDYGKVSGFWLPVRDDTRVRIRVFGQKHLIIEYQDYVVNQPSSPLKSSGDAAAPQSGALGRNMTDIEK